MFSFSISHDSRAGALKPTRAGPGVGRGAQLSAAADGEDAESAERLCAASAVFLALYDEPAAGEAAQDAPPDPSRSCCRLGDLLQQVRARLLPEGGFFLRFRRDETGRLFPGATGSSRAESV